MNKQKYVIASVALLLFGTIFVSSYFGSLGNDKGIKNSSASVWSSVADFFGFGACTPETIPEGSIVDIDDENNTINVTIPYRLSSMCFTPDIQTVYSKAVVTPDPSEPQDFTNPVTYTITQGSFVKSYVMTVKVDSPVNIAKCDDLQKIEYYPSKEYTLANDIDCFDTKNWNNGEGFKPIGNSNTPFSGSFNGNGYTISNLYINRPTEDYVGLFGYATGNISNVGLIDANVTGMRWVGVIAGSVYGGTIENSYSTGNVFASNVEIGGLVGYLMSGVINNSYSGASILGGGDGANLGGLVGRFDDGTIINSYTTGSITGWANLGGIVGFMGGGTIENSYSVGMISGYGSGGLVGYQSYGTNIINSFWNKETSGKTEMCGYVGGSGCDNTYGKTTDEMKKLYTFNSNGGSWDILGGQTDLNNGYPYLSGTNPTWYIMDNTNIPPFICDPTDPNCTVSCVTSDPTNPNCWSTDSITGGPIAWGPANVITGAQSDTDGFDNTARILAISNGSNYPAAEACYNLREGGHSDWYLPAKQQLVDAYINNVTGFQINDYHWSSTEATSDPLRGVLIVGSDNQGSPYMKDEARWFVRCLRGSKYSAPSVSLNASSTTAIEGDTATLTWTPENSTSCTAIGNDPYWNGSSLDATSGSHTWTTAPLTAGTHDYSISCAGDNGNTVTSTVTVVAEPYKQDYLTQNSCLDKGGSWFTYNTGRTECGVDLYSLGDEKCVSLGGNIGSCMGQIPGVIRYIPEGMYPAPCPSTCIFDNGVKYPDFCTSVTYSDWSSCEYGTKRRIVVTSSPDGCVLKDGRELFSKCEIIPTVSLKASPVTVVAGDTATLTWTPENSTSCTANGDDPYWNGSPLDATNGSHTWTTAPLTAGTHDYTISCIGNSLSAAEATVTVVVK